MAGNKSRLSDCILIVNLEFFLHSVKRMGEVSLLGGRWRVKLGPLKRGTCHFRWSCSIWFKAVFLLFEAVDVSWGKKEEEECKVDILPLDITVYIYTQRKKILHFTFIHTKGNKHISKSWLCLTFYTHQIPAVTFIVCNVFLQLFREENYHQRHFISQSFLILKEGFLFL